MLKRAVFSIASSVALAGCASPPAANPLTSTHPASPRAAEVETASLVSQTLAPGGEESAVLAAPVTAPAAGMKHDHGAMQMKPESPAVHEHGGHAQGAEMSKAPSASPASTSQPAPASQAASATAPTTAPTTGPAAYFCPMHADVTAAGPARCPKCNMKLVAKKNP